MKIAVAVTSLILLASTLVAVQPAAAVVVAPTPVVQGNKLVDSQTGATFVPHGVNIPGLEYSCVQGWRTLPEANEFTTIASWKINTVRLPLNESCWLGLDGAPSGSTVAQYKADVAAWVNGATAAGLAVILDLHWNAPAGYTASGQRAMPDERSAAFWTSVATTYAANKSVLFELFNEPYSRTGDGFTLTWDCWKNGGCQAPVENDGTGTLSGAKYTVTGMQTLVSAVRTAGATQPLLLGGLNYSNDLTGWVANKPADPLNQLVVAWHNYPGQGCSTSCWNSTVTTVAASYPIVTTEFGNTAETTSTVAGNSGNYLVPFMTWADAHGIGYLPWAWWDVGAAEAAGNGSDVYALFTGSSFTPKVPSGTKFHDYLASLPTTPPVSTPLAPGALVKDSAGALFLVDGAAQRIPTTAATAAAYGRTTAATLTSAQASAYPATAGALTIAVTCTGVPYIAGGGKLYPVPPTSGLPVTVLDQTTCDAFAKGAAAAGAATFFISTGNQWIYYISGGTKRFMNGLADITAVNGASPRVHIPATPEMLNSIPTQSVWPGALVKDSAGALYLIDGTSTKIPTTAATAAAYGLTTPGTMSDVQAAAYPTASAALTIAVTCGGVPFIAGGGALYPVPANSGLPSTVLDPATCSAFPRGAAAPGAATFFISTGNQWIYYISGGTKRFMNGLADITAVNGTSPRVHIPATPEMLNSIPTQSVWPGALVKDSAGALYLIDGTSQKIPTTAATAAAYGLTTPGTLSTSQASAYTTAPAALTIAVTCGGVPFIAGGGALYPVPANSGLPVTVLDPSTCSAFRRGAAAPGAAVFFISTGNQWIYYINGGTKRFMNGLADITAVNGTSPRVHIPATPEMLNSIPTQSVWPGALVKDSVGALYLIDGSTQKIPTTAATAAAYGLVTPGTITDSQAALYPTSASALTIAVTCGGLPFIAGGGALYPVPANSGLPSTVLDPATCSAFPKGASAPGAATFFISTGNQWIYYISGGTKRFMNGLADITAVNGASPRVHIPATPEMLNSIPTQSVWPGALVKDSAGALYLIDGTSTKIPTTAATAAAYGLVTPGTITDSQAALYTTAASTLTIAVTCGGVPFIAGGGKLYPVPPTSGLPVTVLDPATCSAFSKGAAAPGAATFFISTGNQWIYYINGGTKRFMNGLADITAVNGTSPRVHIPATPEMLNSIPNV